MEDKDRKGIRHAKFKPIHMVSPRTIRKIRKYVSIIDIIFRLEQGVGDTSLQEDTALDWEPIFATRAERMRASEIRELLKLLDQPDIISFAGGIPDPALFPTEAFREAYASVLADGSGRAALQYSVSEGYPAAARLAGAADGHARRRLHAPTTSSSPPARSRRSTISASCSCRPATPRWSPGRPISARCRPSTPMSRATTG